MSKIFFALISVCFIFYQVTAQNFSGRIRYLNTFTDSKGEDIADSITKYLGTHIRYFINDSAFKAYNETDKLLFICRPTTGIYYPDFLDNSIFAADSRLAGAESAIQVKKLSNRRTLCNRDCISVQVKTSGATATYFYDPSLRVQPDVFKNHHLANWNRVLNITSGAVPVQFTYTNNKYGITWTSTAMEIQPMQLMDKDYAEIPGAVIQRNNPDGWHFLETAAWSAAFPGRPVESSYIHTSAVGYLDVHSFEFSPQDTGNKAELSYAVLETTFPDSLVSSAKKEMVETYFRAAMAYTTDKVDGKIIDLSHIQMYGNPGIEIKVLYANNRRLLSERLYLVKDKLYTVSVTSDNDNYSYADVYNFFESFSLSTTP